MAETRVEKYKSYRDSFTKEQSFVEKKKIKKASDSNSITITNTLPIEDVMGQMNSFDDGEVTRKWKRDLIIKTSIISVAAIIVAVVLIVLGMNAFGGK